MITGLYETHLFMVNLEVSINFYTNVLALEQCYFEDKRSAAFFWIGKPKEAMLGLWEKPKSAIDMRHFAFKCDKEFILKTSSANTQIQGERRCWERILTQFLLSSGLFPTCL